MTETETEEQCLITQITPSLIWLEPVRCTCMRIKLVLHKKSMYVLDAAEALMH